MTNPDISLSWAGVFNIAPASNKVLPGDKILLPPSALEQLLAASTVSTPSSRRPDSLHFDPFNPYSLAAARAEQSQWQDTQQQLPHPLTFRLVNTKNGNLVYAGIQEFSAEEGEVGLSIFLLEALGITLPQSKLREDKGGSPSAPIDLTTGEDEGREKEDITPRITIHAKQLPKGTYVKLRPLEAGYDPENWKALLERHLRESFTTLTNGEVLTVHDPKSKEYRFIIDKFAPEGDGICVVDTDLEVDIEALNEEQARETVKQIMKKSQQTSGTAEGSSVGGDLDIWKASAGQVVPGEYVDYQLRSWDRSQGIDIELTTDDGEDIELFISPYSPRQRQRPRDDEHVFADFSSKSTRHVVIQATNIELEIAEALYISVYSRPKEVGHANLHRFSIQYKVLSQSSMGSSKIPISFDNETQRHGVDEKQCNNCHQWIPERTMMLHENFCLRNNILCPHCQNVFHQKSQEWQNHWHCEYDPEHGTTIASKVQHDKIFHTSKLCPNCPYVASNLMDLALHRTSICPGKVILCQFCHLEVPQEGDPFDPSPEALISGLTAHELVDGARTTDCHLCSKIIRLRDMSTHLKHHELEKSNKAKPRICRNINCGRTLDGVGKNGEIGAGRRMGQGPGNELGLCSLCFGPLYVSMHDPEGRAMRRRVERRYLTQLMSGCGKKWCMNQYCKTAKAKAGNIAPLTAQTALPLVKPLMDSLGDKIAPMHFCTDEGSQKRRVVAEMLDAEKIYDMEWCLAALEAETGNLEHARTWLANWAPTR